MSSLLDKISELEWQLASLRAEAEKENKSINRRWKAEYGEGYWLVDADGIPKWWHEYGRDVDGFYYDTHNYFQTREEAQKYANVLETERQLKKFADEHNSEIDWSNNNQEKWNLYYYYDLHEINIAVRCAIK